MVAPRRQGISSDSGFDKSALEAEGGGGAGAHCEPRKAGDSPRSRVQKARNRERLFYCAYSIQY